MRPEPRPPLAGLDLARHFVGLDHLATMVVVVTETGQCLYANSAFEQGLGLSRRAVLGAALTDWFDDPSVIQDTVLAVARNQFATSRFEAQVRRGLSTTTPDIGQYQVIVSHIEQMGLALVELLELSQQTRHDREERLMEQARENKELIRNLAHEIKNPLGGIRGAAQLLQMEIESRELTEYTQVIIHEADRLQVLVDRLLAPHRRPHLVGDVNVHEVCERCARADRGGISPWPGRDSGLRCLDPGVSR